MPTTQYNQVGPQLNQDGSIAPTRGGKLGDTIVSELHGRFYEQCYRGNLYSGGLTALTTINAATNTISTLGATAVPISGLWNPTGSGVNAAILQATLGVTVTAATATGPGPYMWAVSGGNGAITTGAVPFNRLTLQQVGSKVKNMAGVALTNLTNNLVVIMGSSLGGGQALSFSFVGTAAGAPSIMPGGNVENFDGSLIIPPGGVLALLATTTGVAHSAVSSLMWEEVPV